MSLNKTEPVIAIVGATASGKSALAQEVADATGASLLSVDSRKIYRGMDIGTAKPSREAIARYRYAMIDCVDPKERFSAAEFARQAQSIVSVRRARGERVILVGGTGFYLEAFRNGLAELPEIDKDVRNHVIADAETRGWAALHTDLLRIDPEWASSINPNDKTRLRRATEVYRQTGTPLSQWLSENPMKAAPWEVITLYFERPKDELEKRIVARTEKMIAAGLAEEVKLLLENGHSGSDPGLATVGYAETVRFLAGEINVEKWREEIIVHTRQYAKKQRTWFRYRDYIRLLELDHTAVQHVTSHFED